ncbi:hypothetical protein [Streptomyces amritsarensis]|uniref:hypothetical protein n=1 Tax=Streptomyces amritsarensis TaxID=681158 RepID=UPI00368106C0
MDLTTPAARQAYAEVLREQEKAQAGPARVVDFSRPQVPLEPPARPRWFEVPYDDPSRLGFHIVRKQQPTPRGPSGLPDIVD